MSETHSQRVRLGRPGGGGARYARSYRCKSAEGPLYGQVFASVYILYATLLYPGFMPCNTMREGRMVRVDHGDAIPERRGGQCMRCECNNGQFMCSRPEGDDNRCPRSDPDMTPMNCMMNGEMVMHREQRQVRMSSLT